MDNESFKKLLKEYKKTVIKESYNESNLIKTIGRDAGKTTGFWLDADMDEFISKGSKEQYDWIDGSIDDYTHDDYDGIKNELPKDINIDKWLKKNRKKIIIATIEMIKKINK